MKRIHKAFAAILLVIVLTIITGAITPESTRTKLELSNQEKEWLKNNKTHVLTLGIDPYSGIEYFNNDGQQKGYLVPLIKRISNDLGINIRLEASKPWSEVFSGLQTGSIDILFGANETPERDNIMNFTQPVYREPYAIIAKKNGPIHTIGDIDKKTVGFMRNDFIINAIPKLYKHIKYNIKLYESQDEGVKSLRNNKIDAFITSGGPAVYDYIYKYPELSYAFKINAITSDMTFSTKKNNKIVVDLLNKEISYLSSNGLQQLISKSIIDYNIKIMNLKPKELNWLKTKGTAVVGVTKDYLPFDYYVNNQFHGIDGKIINEISNMTGIKFTYYYSDFDDLYSKLKSGKINVLNIAKTDDRLKYILYPEPFSMERDVIFGRKDEPDVRDIFGLEGKRVAVIKGFWHYELLTKNLTNVKIIDTNNIEESMSKVHDGEADYFIENPTVARYYIENLQLYDLVQRGDTSTDSFLYLGISKNKPELASIINKVLPMMDIDQLSRSGYDEVPHLDSNKNYHRLILITIGLSLLLFLIIMYVAKLIKDLIKQKTETELLRQKEYLLSMDVLTEVHNGNYFNSKVKDGLDFKPYPQALIVADMNNLKVVNDNYGHLIGDSLLKLFADVLKETCPQNNHIFRIGGDEFIIFLDNSTHEDAEKIIKNIKFLSSKKYIVINEDISISPTVALGYSTRNSSKISFNELFKSADSKMYEDKKLSKEI